MNFLKSFSILAFLIGGALSADADTECWSLKLGYPCCQLKTTRVSYTDKATGNLYGVEFNKMCGITSAQLCPKGDTYKCCSSCTVTYIDTYYWGIEDGQWCSIPYDCEDEINAIVKKTTKKGKTTTITSTKTKAITTIVIEPIETATIEPVISTITVEPVETATIKPVISTITVEPVETATIEPVISTITVDPVETATIEPVETTVPKCARVFEMCGGSAFPDVPTCCEEGSFCWSLNEAYHQCIPDYLKEFTEVKTTTVVEDPTTKVDEPTTKVDEPTTTTIAATTTEAQVGTNGCALNFQPCGGLSNPDAPNCCQEGFTCFHNDKHYHQCIPKFYLENTTTTTSTKPTISATTEEVVSKITTSSVVEVSSVATTASEVTTLPTETETETETTTDTTTVTETETETETETTTEASETIGQVAPTTTPVASDAVCGKLYDACGGSDYPNTPTCCEPGSVCIVLDTTTYQCLPERLPIGIFRPPPPPPFNPYYPPQPYSPQNPPPAYYPPPPPNNPFNPTQPYGPQNPLPNYPPPPSYPRPYAPQPYYPPPPQPYTPQNPPPAYYPPPPPPFDPTQE